MSLSTPSKIPNLYSSLIFPWIPTSTLKKKMTTLMVASISPPHISPLNPPLSLFENCQSMDHLKQIHSQSIRRGLASNPIVNSKIIAFCCAREWGCLSYARHVFDKIPEPNVFIWNTMIKGYNRINCPKNAVSVYKEMLEKNVRPDHYTFPFLLKGFTGDVALQCGKLIHAHVCKFEFDSNLFVQNALICMYSLCGQIDIARGVFNMSSKNDVVTWNVMISGYNRSKLFDESVKLFNAMEKGLLPTSVTLVSVLSACSKLKDLDTGRRVHHYVISGMVEANLILENALIDMYAGCGAMEVALGIFQSMKKRDIISWTAIVTGFANAGQVDLARKYFDQMPERDFVSWTAMIDGYLCLNQFKEVLILFREMQAAKIKPDEFTMVSILTACAHLGALELGEWVKAYIEKNHVKNDIYVANALIDMYFKCGDEEKAVRVFNKMARKDKFTWTAMIVGLAINGQGKEALDMLSDMLSASITPDEVTYIGVLCACTHTGMVDEGRKFFSSMTTEHGIEPNVAHYGCMVDLLGRAGHLREAYELIKNMPMKPNSMVWGALLGACRVHKNVEMAEMAAKQLLQLEPENSAVYVLLCNIYAVCNRWENLREVRNMMMDKGIKKTPGCSLIEMNGMVHEFVAGDRSHPQSEEIFSKLEQMIEDLNFSGYIPNTLELSLDIGEEEKESALNRQSEKLAIAFGLISSEPGVTIRIVKNLRMCVDCHLVAKLVSRMYNREVIVRDRTRFHHFRYGSCSCKDYW
ncbi:Pentatricopeptide repeat-containing protein [Actinidia chinensis var. chinensis]|uniref:Pentatricopeptide repeat-containing protein n=1 Tax=Actinidia chinensis var. chinensis TaxID=1590841 RepID=A0A2R6QG22_ACTCC|nr:Pentatricopeptide repeat-containing protein [Actinidia chinensis var. chinensis]